MIRAWSDNLKMSCCVWRLSKLCYPVSLTEKSVRLMFFQAVKSRVCVCVFLIADWLSSAKAAGGLHRALHPLDQLTDSGSACHTGNRARLGPECLCLLCACEVTRQTAARSDRNRMHTCCLLFPRKREGWRLRHFCPRCASKRPQRKQVVRRSLTTVCISSRGWKNEVCRQRSAILLFSQNTRQVYNQTKFSGFLELYKKHNFFFFF